MRSRVLWLLTVLLLAATVWFVGDGGRWWLQLLLALVVVYYAWWCYPRRGAGRRTGTPTEGHEPVVIYWRPGCLYCSALRRSLGRTGRAATWVNIWTDEDAAAYVRAVNGGNETVPTVLIDGVAHTNPPADQVRARLVPVG